jgi:hypothetical protein
MGGLVHLTWIYDPSTRTAKKGTRRDDRILLAEMEDWLWGSTLGYFLNSVQI